MDNVENLCEGMHVYSVEDYLTGDLLLMKYDPHVSFVHLLLRFVSYFLLLYVNNFLRLIICTSVFVEEIRVSMLLLTPTHISTSYLKHGNIMAILLSIFIMTQIQYE